MCITFFIVIFCQSKNYGQKEIITMTNENEKKIPTVEEPAALKLSDEEMEKIAYKNAHRVIKDCIG